MPSAPSTTKASNDSYPNHRGPKPDPPRVDMDLATPIALTLDCLTQALAGETTIEEVARGIEAVDP